MNDSDRDMMLARIDENVGHIKESIIDHQAKDDKTHADLAKRLTSLEETRSRQKGAIGAGIAIVSALWAAVVVVVGWLWGK